MGQGPKTEGLPTDSAASSKTQHHPTDSEEKLMSRFGVWNLPGVEECGEMSVVVRSSQGQLVEWNGLKLHIHAGSLPEGLQRCTIFIKASLAGEYEIPDNTSLVSAIFWLRCEPECTFTKHITVEIQHCSTKRDLSKLKIVRALCSQMSRPYKFKPLKGGRFDAETFYGAIEVTRFSGLTIAEERSISNRLYYNQLFYCVDQQKRDIHIIYTLNTVAHINYVLNEKYTELCGYHAGCYQVIELDGDIIEVGLDKERWTEVMDGQWQIYPIKYTVTKAELDNFEIGGGIPNCVLEAHPLVQPIPRLLHKITLNGVKPPYNELTLRLPVMPSREDQHRAPPGVPSATHTLMFSSSMSDEDFFKWLRSRGVSNKDCYVLFDNGITPSGFLQFDAKDFDDIGLTKFGKRLFLKIFTQAKGHHCDQQPSERDCSHDGSIGHAPQHSGQIDGSNEHTVNDGGGSAHGSSGAASVANTTSDNPPTQATLLRILLPVSQDWVNIGTMLALSDKHLTAIKARCKDVPDKCLKEMLSDWLKQTNPRPTKSALVDAVEMYNPSLADEISAL